MTGPKRPQGSDAISASAEGGENLNRCIKCIIAESVIDTKVHIAVEVRAIPLLEKFCGACMNSRWMTGLIPEVLRGRKFP